MTTPLDSSTRSLLFLLASTREGGNTELLARRAAEVLPPGTRAHWLRLDAHAPEPFRDLRHDAGGYPPLGSEAMALFERTVEADELVFVAPVYWYSLPSSAKQYLEQWSWWMRRPELRFRERMKGRVLSVVTTLSGPDESAQPLIESLRLTANYMQMGWRGALIGNGSAPGDVLKDPRAWEAARDWLVRPLAEAKSAA